MISPLWLMGIGFLTIFAYMTVVFIVAKRINNYAIVDVAWAFGFSIIACTYASCVAPLSLRHWSVILMVLFWSLRLTWHLGARFKRWYPNEDARYAEFRKKLGSFVGAKMFLIFLWQGALVVLLIAPLAVALTDARSGLGCLQWFAVAVWLIALIGEATADEQLSRFSSAPQNSGRTCQVGLWQYSRHPNYFFEWLGAFAFFLYASDSPYGLWTLASPLLLLHLLLNVTGVKLSEEHSLKTRVDYSEYVKRTSCFIPWRRSLKP